jgi:hypothetical protein
MADLFTPEELDTLSAEIDRQLKALAVGKAEIFVRAGRTPEQPAASPQRAAIEHATGEPATSFLARFRQAARRDICQPGGILHEQWVKYQDIANKDALKVVGRVLDEMKIKRGVLQGVAVAIIVYLLHLGLEAFCQEA